MSGDNTMNSTSESASGQQAVLPPMMSDSRGWTAERIIGTTWLFLWALGGLGILWFLLDSNNVALSVTWAEQFPYFADVRLTADASFLEKFGGKLLDGFIVTLQLVAASLVLGALISIPTAAMRMTTIKLLRWIAYAYVYFFRGTPLLAQTFLIYYGSGSFQAVLKDVGMWWFFRDAWNCALLAFSLNTGAYQAEILRGSIQNVPKGQWEAADALGLSRLVTFWKIILPQALIVSLRPYGNEIILMIKGSAIASIITIFDLMGETRRAFSRTFDFQAYIWAALAYLIMVETLRRLWDVFERRLTRHIGHH
ncbi:ABC transporter permease [Polycladidibacter hongkongensis]|uniref:ABC transporter permease n=1 Tax=Polycladidibacter hongkongensis TaxID=1647556 RepID=UPI000B327F27|nr:ABC transporter permease [Pseudovibrio hongkongensis]